jgi:hypothetical protein
MKLIALIILQCRMIVNRFITILDKIKWNLKKKNNHQNILNLLQTNRWNKIIKLFQEISIVLKKVNSNISSNSVKTE